MSTSLNEREQAHEDAYREVRSTLELYQNGLVTLSELAWFMAQIHERLPKMQAGDVDPNTGLRAIG